MRYGMYFCWATISGEKKPRAMSFLLDLLAGVASAVALLAIFGFLYQKLGTARDMRKHPPLGQLVDIGGRRLHLWCTGEGSPTVVLDSGLPGSSLSWTLVQPEVARFTRVCSYDRAGLGWSDPGPPPRTTARIVEDLRALLERARIEPPYVVVGHSFSAFTARLYASQYPDEVAGIVLVDPIHPREWLGLSPERERGLRRAVQLSRYGAFLVALGLGRLVAWLIRIGAGSLARFLVLLVAGGAVRGRESLMESAWKLPPELRSTVGMFWTQPKSYRALADQIEALPVSAAQVAAMSDLGDMPLVVLSASNSDSGRRSDHDAAAQLSSRGRHLVALESGHWIQLDRPECVVTTIRDVCEAARRRQPGQSAARA